MKFLRKHFLMSASRRLLLCFCNVGNTRGVFKALPNFYNIDFLQKVLKTFFPEPFSKKIFIRDNWRDPKYTYEPNLIYFEMGISAFAKKKKNQNQVLSAVERMPYLLWFIYSNLLVLVNFVDGNYYMQTLLCFKLLN